MVERIKKLIEKNNLSATQFAEQIGVQRSAVSHLLSGRNKPSLDFMLKVKRNFPEVRLDWLLLGEGKMKETKAGSFPKTENVRESLFTGNEETKASTENTLESGVEEMEIPFNVVESEGAPVYRQKKTAPDLVPEKLILLYSDQTFKLFNTRQQTKKPGL